MHLYCGDNVHAQQHCVLRTMDSSQAITYCVPYLQLVNVVRTAVIIDGWFTIAVRLCGSHRKDENGKCRKYCASAFVKSLYPYRPLKQCLIGHGHHGNSGLWCSVGAVSATF